MRREDPQSCICGRHIINYRRPREMSLGIQRGEGGPRPQAPENGVKRMPEKESRLRTRPSHSSLPRRKRTIESSHMHEIANRAVSNPSLITSPAGAFLAGPRSHGNVSQKAFSSLRLPITAEHHSETWQQCLLILCLVLLADWLLR